MVNNTIYCNCTSTTWK